MHSTHIAVTAASGNLGREIIRALQACPGEHTTIGLARTPKKAASLGVEVRPGDYNEPEQLRTSLTGVHALLLVSGMDAPDVRIQQHRHVIEAAKSAGVRKIVYTSIQGLQEKTGFSGVVMSNRQTEQDIKASGLEWVIGRNGIYIEPDVQYIDTYKKHGEIANCAEDQRCGYTTREELAYAYARMLLEPVHHGKTYNLHGELLTQSQLAAYLGKACGTTLTYRAMSVDAYRDERIHELGPFLGGVIAGIYEGIRLGALDVPGDYEAAAGRPHKSWDEYFTSLHL